MFPEDFGPDHVQHDSYTGQEACSAAPRFSLTQSLRRRFHRTLKIERHSREKMRLFKRHTPFSSITKMNRRQSRRSMLKPSNFHGQTAEPVGAQSLSEQKTTPRQQHSPQGFITTGK